MSLSPAGDPSPLRQSVFTGLLIVGFLIACHFYGVGFNLLFLWLSTLGLVVVLLLARPAGIVAVLERSPALGYSCIAWLAMIAIQHLFFSLSPDTSFAASWILAAIPAWALVALMVDTRVLFRAMSLLVFAFAALSVVFFLLQQQRAHAPLTDPNNYVTLLYLAWIPWVMDRSCSPGPHESMWGTVWTGFGSFCVCLAMFATHSRFAMLVVAGVSLLLLFLVFWYRRGIRGCVAQWGGTLTALGLYFVMTGGAMVGGGSGPMASEDARLLILKSTWEAILELGSLNGTGLFTFSVLYPLFRSPLEQGTAGQFVHNDYLQLALEGGVWLLLPILLLSLAVGVIGLGCLRRRTWDERLPFLTALAVVCVHATVNFVFYVLPLTIMIGVLIALAFGRPGQFRLVEARLRTRLHGVVAWLVLACGLVVNSLYLALDTMTYGVFSAQLYVPFSSYIRADTQRVLNYARFAQSLNGQRGIPILGEAMVLQAQVNHAPSQFGVAQARSAFQRAIAADPWNPLAYVSSYQFRRQYPTTEGAETSSPQALLKEALRVDPVNLQAMRLLFDEYLMAARYQDASALAAEVLQWCELLARRHRYELRDLIQYLHAAQRQHPQLGLGDLLNRCQNASDAPPFQAGYTAPWLMRWLRAKNEG